MAKRQDLGTVQKSCEGQKLWDFMLAVYDLPDVAPACLRHRIALNFEAVSDGKTPDDVIALLLKAQEK